MKTLITYTLLIAALVGFISCEEVVDIEVPKSEPRLVLDALIRADTTQEFVDVKIKASLTNAFFEAVEPVSDITSMYIYYGIENEFGEIVDGLYSNLAESIPGSGIYIPDPDFTSDQRIRTSDIGDGTAFWLVVEHQDRRYAGKTYYESSVPIDSLEQDTVILFDEEQTELIITYTDDPEKENYYLFDFDFANFIASSDTFYEGQTFSFSYFYDTDFSPGDEITVSILGVDQDFFNYMNLLISQSEGSFGPFETPSATVRGNIFDVTGIDNINQFNNVENPDNFPLGYFSFSQVFSQTLVIQ